MIRKGIIITNLFAIICCIKFILIDLTTFDLSYIVYDRESHIKLNTYILYCTIISHMVLLLDLINHFHHMKCICLLKIEKQNKMF